MRLRGLRDPQKRDKYFSLVRKRFLQSVRLPRDCKPVFVFGNQRSGTSMLMFAFHRHPETIVFDEHRNSPVFRDFRIRGLDVIKDVISESRFEVACFKPICDSHLIAEFVRAFPNAHHIWIYRQFGDVANSALRKFETPTRAIRLVCMGKPGGGWFDEGVSADVRRVLADVYSPELSDFDLCCLVWWARNRIIMESGLLPSPDLTMIKYEELVANPHDVLSWLFRRMGVTFSRRITSRISPRSVGRHASPPMHDDVRKLCDDLMRQLDEAYFGSSPPESGAVAGIAS